MKQESNLNEKDVAVLTKTEILPITENQTVEIEPKSTHGGDLEEDALLVITKSYPNSHQLIL
jgi:hypothetical protein